MKIVAANSKLFRDYIGAESDKVKLSEVPINPKVEFHFILAFAIDYTHDIKPSNGRFNVFWDTKNLGPKQISSTKQAHSNVKFAVSLGGDSVTDHQKAIFRAKSISSWLQNAISSLTEMIKFYNIDGIDIDYEHFAASPEVFSECIGRLITTLKKSGTISFASIAPYEDDDIQRHYLALWSKYGDVIDYVNFQFYAYDKLSVPKFIQNYNKQVSNYGGGQVLASFQVKNGGGLNPKDGFFEACNTLLKQGKLGGVFLWCADESEGNGFEYEKKSQKMLASFS